MPTYICNNFKITQLLYTTFPMFKDASKIHRKHSDKYFHNPTQNISLSALPHVNKKLLAYENMKEQMLHRQSPHGSFYRERGRRAGGKSYSVIQSASVERLKCRRLRRVRVRYCYYVEDNVGYVFFLIFVTWCVSPVLILVCGSRVKVFGLIFRVTFPDVTKC